MLAAKRKDTLSCKLCSRNYNNDKLRPMALIPCGHTYCSECIDKLTSPPPPSGVNEAGQSAYTVSSDDFFYNDDKENRSCKRCPTCKARFNQSIPDYDLLDTINYKFSTKLSNTQSDLQIDEKLALTQEVIDMIMGSNKAEKVRATQIVRKLLSKEKNPPIDEVISSNLVPVFAQFIKTDSAGQREDTDLVFESLWVLTNVASGTTKQTQTVIDANVIPSAIKLIESPDSNVKEQAIWLLGNIAGDSPKTRDLVLSHGIIEPLREVISNPNNELTVIKNAMWCLSNLCRGRSPSVNITHIRPCLKLLSDFLFHKDAELVADVCWALSYLTDGSNERIQIVLDSVNLKALVDLLDHESTSVLQAALRTVGNIVTGNDQQTQFIVDLNVLPKLCELLDSPKRSIRKETCWMLSNITAGTQAQIQKCIDSNVFPKLIDLMVNGDPDVSKEAVWVINNATSGGSNVQIKYLIHLNVIPALCEVLAKRSYPNLVLETLESLLVFGEHEETKDGLNPYAILINECGGLDQMHLLALNGTGEVATKCSDLIETYFQNDDDDDLVEDLF